MCEGRRIVEAPQPHQRREERKQGVPCSGLFVIAPVLRSWGSVSRRRTLGDGRPLRHKPALWALAVMIAAVGGEATDEAEQSDCRRGSARTGDEQSEEGGPRFY